MNSAQSSTPGGGINPQVWGGAAWKFIECVLYGFNPQTQDKAALCRFINTLPDVLPCHKCRVNFSQTLEKYPFDPYCQKDQCDNWFKKVRAEVRKHETKSASLSPSQRTYSTGHNAAVDWKDRRLWWWGVGAVAVGFGLGLWAHRLYQQQKQRQDYGGNAF